MKSFTKTFINDALPFLELRYSNSNTHYKEHFHDTFSLGVNKIGESTYTNSGKEYLLKAGRLSIMNPKAVHACNASSEQLNQYYMMYLDAQWCTHIQRLINDKVTNFINIPVALLEDQSCYEEFISLCELLFTQISPEEKEQALIEFYLEFFARFLDQTQQSIQDEKFELIRNYLDQNFKEAISLEALALAFDCNKFYMIKLFKSQMNLTPHAYLLNLRINHAKELLKQQQPLSSVALECGFFDQSHFHRNFLKIVATTPKAYQDNFVQ